MNANARDNAEIAVRGARLLLREAGKLLDSDGETVRHNITLAQVAADDALDAIASARETDIEIAQMEAGLRADAFREERGIQMPGL